MSLPAAVQDLLDALSHRYGEVAPFGRSRLYRVGGTFCCSVNYSKLLRGDKYFFGLSRDVVTADAAFPETEHGDFVLLVCGDAGNALVLPRSLVLTMMSGVETRRVDVFVDDGRYVLQTTRHPKVDVTAYLNAYPKPPPETPTPQQEVADAPAVRQHVAVQWALIRLGLAEGCAVWVPPGDRHLAHGPNAFASNTLDRVPHLGFDEETRRIVLNIDVLWMRRNVILKAFEIESTTTIYSGLLRLNDLALSQPNNRIEMYVAAARARREHVYRQLLRPSFRPLIPKCRFIGFEEIEAQAGRLDGLGADARVSGLLRGEHFALPDHIEYPLDDAR